MILLFLDGLEQPLCGDGAVIALREDLNVLAIAEQLLRLFEVVEIGKLLFE